MNTSFSFVNRKNPFSEATHRFEKAIGSIDQTNFRDLREVMTALPHLRFRPGYTLDCCRVGDTTNFYRKLYVYRQDSEDYYRGLISFEAFDTVPPIEDYLDIDFTPESVWEAVLLIKEGASYLEHGWHGNYASGALVVDSVSLIENTRIFLKDYVICLWLKDDRIYPRVEMLEEYVARVSYCRWGEWPGLTYWTFIVRRQGRTVKIEENTREVLESNDNGIIF